MSSSENKKGGGLLGKLTDAIFESDESRSDTSNTGTLPTTTVPITTSVPTSRAAYTAIPPTTSSPTNSGSAYTELRAQLNQTQHEGNAFFDVLVQLEAESVGDASTQYRLALKFSKLTKEQVIGAIDARMNRLGQIERAYQTQVDASYQKNVVARENRISDARTRITQAQADIARLEAQIQQLDIEKSQAESEITQSKNSFSFAHGTLIDELTAQKVTLENNL